MKTQKNKKGFSLIESIIVIGILALVLPAIFAVVFSILQQQVRIYRLTEVKRQGDYALNTIQTVIRTSTSGLYNSAALTTVVCNNNTAASNIFFKDINSTPLTPVWFKFYASGTNLVYEKSVGPAGGDKLTTTRVKIKANSFKISCKRGNNSAPYIVTVEYTVAFNTDLANNPELPYRTVIVLRNF